MALFSQPFFWAPASEQEINRDGECAASYMIDTWTPRSIQIRAQPDRGTLPLRFSQDSNADQTGRFSFSILLSCKLLLIGKATCHSLRYLRCSCAHLGAKGALLRQSACTAPALLEGSSTTERAGSNCHDTHWDRYTYSIIDTARRNLLRL